MGEKNRLRWYVITLNGSSLPHPFIVPTPSEIMKWKASFFFFSIYHKSCKSSHSYLWCWRKPLTARLRKVTEHKHQQAPYVGGELNLIRASKKPVSALFRGRSGKPSQATVSMNTPQILHHRCNLECRDITQFGPMLKLESYWKDILFRYRAAIVATTRPIK